MLRLLAAIIVPFVIFLSLRADAEDAPAAEAGAPGRYVLQPTEGGYLRMDTASGRVAFCHRGTAGWICEYAADDMRTIDEEMSRLMAENRRLRARVAELERQAGRPPAAPERGFEVPDEQELDRAMAYMERMMRRFIEMMKSIARDERGKPI